MKQYHTYLLMSIRNSQKSCIQARSEKDTNQNERDALRDQALHTKQGSPRPHTATWKGGGDCPLIRSC